MRIRAGHAAGDGRAPVSPARACAAAALAGLLAVVAAPAGASARKSIGKVAGPCRGSSNPTFFANNRRLVRVARGRLLAVYDAHGSGEQLAWKNPHGRWRRRTRGTVRNGFFPGRRHGDRPGSIVVGRDAAGRQHAWVVWAGAGFRAGRLPLSLRRLSGLRAVGGPRVGPEVELAQPGSGHARPDIALEGAGRSARAAIVWVDRAGLRRFDLTAAWLGSLGTDTPQLVGRRVLLTTRRGSPSATLVPTPTGLRVAAVTAHGRLIVFKHRRGSPLTRWVTKGAGVKVSRKAKPAGVVTGRSLLVTARGRRRHAIRVIRFRRNGSRPRVVLALRGYVQPSLTRVGRRVLLVMVRTSDNRVVSRTLAPRHRWTRRDRVEIGKTRGRKLAWPSPARTSQNVLRFVVEGARCRTRRGATGVLSFSRRA